MNTLEYKKESNTLILTFLGDILSTNVNTSMNEFNKIEDRYKLKNIKVNLEKVNMIDSQGLNLLIGIYQECLKKSVNFTVSNVSDPVLKLLKFVKLDKKFSV